MLNTTSQWQDPEILIFCYNEQLGHMLKPLVLKFRSELSVRLRDTYNGIPYFITKKQVPAKLKPIVVAYPAGFSLMSTREALSLVPIDFPGLFSTHICSIHKSRAQN